jgi:hypothetical protein
LKKQEIDMRRKPQSEEQKLEALAATMRRAHETAEADHEQKAVDAHHELNRPDHAKGRPFRDHGCSNAGNDGGC